MNTVKVLENLRDELDADWSDSHGGYSSFVVEGLIPDSPDLHTYVETIAKDAHTTKRARRLAGQALEALRDDKYFLGACGIAADLEMT